MKAKAELISLILTLIFSAKPIFSYKASVVEYEATFPNGSLAESIQRNVQNYLEIIEKSPKDVRKNIFQQCYCYFLSSYLNHLTIERDHCDEMMHFKKIDMIGRRIFSKELTVTFPNSLNEDFLPLRHCIIYEKDCSYPNICNVEMRLLDYENNFLNFAIFGRVYLRDKNAKTFIVKAPKHPESKISVVDNNNHCKTLSTLKYELSLGKNDILALLICLTLFGFIQFIEMSQ